MATSDSVSLITIYTSTVLEMNVLQTAHLDVWEFWVSRIIFQVMENSLPPKLMSSNTWAKPTVFPTNTSIAS